MCAWGTVTCVESEEWRGQGRNGWREGGMGRGMGGGKEEMVGEMGGWVDG